SPQDNERWCKVVWEVLLNEWEALLKEIEGNPNHPDYNPGGTYYGDYEFEYDADRAEVLDGYEEEEEEAYDDGFDRRENLHRKVRTMLRECKGRRKVMLKEAGAMYRLNHPHPVRASIPQFTV
ncbi:unnamed protein product, partial [Laminaria digitata]